MQDYVTSDSVELGPEIDFEPAFVDVFAEPIQERHLEYYDESDFLEWELGAAVPLAEVGWCTRLDADVVGPSFDDVRLPAPFTDGRTVYTVAARPALLTDDC